MCQEGFGGVDCGVATASGAECFSGTRSDGSTNSNYGACKTCYRCQAGYETKVDGKVTVAGDPWCNRVDGPENMCLSCSPSVGGILRYGDTHSQLYDAGYVHAGRCQPYPKVSQAKMVHSEEAPWDCEERCYPQKSPSWHMGGHMHMGCTKVCSQWNAVTVTKDNANVAVTALCHLTKDAHCHANITASLETLNDSAHTCVSKKRAAPSAICYSLKYHGTSSFDEGYGSTCEGDSIPTDDAALHKWLQAQVSGSERWCCYHGTSTALPAWLSVVPSHQWCSSTAMRA